LHPAALAFGGGPGTGAGFDEPTFGAADLH
jgi:hypothetical protein